MKQIETTYENNFRRTRSLVYAPQPDDGQQELAILNLYPGETFQTMLGFGGAFTEAAGWTLAQMRSDVQGQMLDAYFGPGGAGLHLGPNPHRQL